MFLTLQPYKKLAIFKCGVISYNNNIVYVISHYQIDGTTSAGN